MEKQLKLNVIWNREKLIVNDKHLSEVERETYIYDEIKSSANEIFFTNPNTMENVKKSYKYSITLFLIKILLLWLISNGGGFIVEKIGIVLLISLGITFIWILSIPFISFKTLVFNINEKSKKSKIFKINVLNSSSEILNLDFPMINRVVFKKFEKNTYVTFREKKSDIVSETAPIICIENTDLEQLQEIERLLERFLQNVNRTIEIVHL
ncbi:hypothetical protein [Flavobacterium oreochromis]|uniref:DUF304 domain-containing protein n=1 Tax=Flavobacterium oreochromis TaxID=2906078 RepID=A0ABW8P8H9_9FLAO|nr:hypothetical protein [Flavobacterium oreochromis]